MCSWPFRKSRGYFGLDHVRVRSDRRSHHRFDWRALRQLHHRGGRLADYIDCWLHAGYIYFASYERIQLSANISTLVICVIVFLLVTSIAVSLPHVTIAEFKPFLPHGWSAAGSVSDFFSFVGWEMITPLAEEFHRPEKDVRSACFWQRLVWRGCISCCHL